MNIINWKLTGPWKTDPRRCCWPLWTLHFEHINSMLSMLFYLQLLPSVAHIIYRILSYMYMYILFGYSNVTLLAFVQSFIVEYFLLCNKGAVCKYQLLYLMAFHWKRENLSGLHKNQVETCNNLRSCWNCPFSAWYFTNVGGFKVSTHLKNMCAKKAFETTSSSFFTIWKL